MKHAFHSLTVFVWILVYNFILLVNLSLQRPNYFEECITLVRHLNTSFLLTIMTDYCLV